jgi:hypothetical protein
MDILIFLFTLGGGAVEEFDLAQQQDVASRPLSSACGTVCGLAGNVPSKEQGMVAQVRRQSKP